MVVVGEGSKSISNKLLTNYATFSFLLQNLNLTKRAKMILKQGKSWQVE